ncbi:SH3 domain-containing protein [Pseudonocardia sp. DLS-67]
MKMHRDVRLAGRVGSWLAARLGLISGRNALLLVRGLPDPEVGAVPCAATATTERS